MKKFLLPLIIAATVISCRSSEKDDLAMNKEATPVDSTIFYNSNAYTDISQDALNEQKAIAPSKKSNTTRKTTQRVNTPVQTPVTIPPVITETPQPETAPASTNAPVNTTGDSGSPGSTGTGTETATTQKKKGWSDAAKGATIGGVGGAIAGAIISKNKAKGAVIGGIIGAAGGYVLGRKRDKNSGRIDYAIN